MITVSRIQLPPPTIDIPRGLEAFTFAAPAKCGCVWVLQSLAHAGVTHRKWDSTRVHKPGKLEGVPSVTVRRNPCDWLRSYWHNMRGRIAAVPEVDVFSTLDLTSLDSLAESYLERMPGAISRMFMAYESDYVLELDGLADQFADLMERLEVQHDAAVLRTWPPENVTPNKAGWTQELYDRVLEVDGVAVGA
jgi:hypothetical protein